MLSKFARELARLPPSTECPRHIGRNRRSAVEAYGQRLDVLGLSKCPARLWRRLFVLSLLALTVMYATAAGAAEIINAYSIWPENWARPMLQEFEAATGIKVNFLRF